MVGLWPRPSWLSVSSSVAVTLSSVYAHFGVPLSCLRSVLHVFAAYPGTYRILFLSNLPVISVSILFEPFPLKYAA